MNTISESVITTTRKSMSHLSAMKPEDFITWLKKVKKEAGGVLSDYKTSLKADGMGGRIGRDSSGRIFFEGSRTGPISDSGAFSTFAKNNNRSNDVIIRAQHYDDMLELFKKADFMSVIPNDTKVICEILYNPLASVEADSLTFVSVKYDKTKLGSLMSIIPIDIIYASTGIKREDREKIMEDLYKKSNNEIKIINPKLKMNDIDINLVIDSLATLDDNALTIIKSRKAIDKPAKENILGIIQKAKDELTDHLLKHPGIENRFMLGTELEGIVVDIPDIGTYKIVDPVFKISKSYPPKAAKPVELFLGRLQPPHLGHKKNIDSMKNPVIGIVRGSKSGQDKERNPLELDYQIELIKKFAPQAIIKVFPDGFLPFIVSSLRQEGLEVISIYAGTDRINSYQQSITSFNKKLPDDRKINVEFEEIARGNESISATKVRAAIRAGDEKTFRESVPKELWGEFNKLMGLLKEETQFLSFRAFLDEEGEVAPNATNTTPNISNLEKPVNKKTLRRKRPSFYQFLTVKIKNN